MRNKLQLIGLRTELILPGDNLQNAIEKALVHAEVSLDEGDILAITSKVVSLCEGRIKKIPRISKHTASDSTTHRYGAYDPDPDFEALVDQESDIRFPGDMFLTIKDGIFVPSAGIDTSNVEEGTAVLWPKNPQQSADNLLAIFKQKTRIGNMGVMIVDSHIQPLRDGVTSFCLACSGFEGVEDLHGHKDIFEKELKVTKRAIADSLASACSLIMGEADEQIPFVLIREAPVTFSQRQMSPDELKRQPKDCLFSPLYPKDL